METRGSATSNVHLSRPSVDVPKDFFPSPQEKLNETTFNDDVIDLLTRQFTRQCVATATTDVLGSSPASSSDDQGIGSSREGSSSSSEEEADGDRDLTELIDLFISFVMALDLRKKKDHRRFPDDDDDCKPTETVEDVVVSDEDNTCEALDLTAKKTTTAAPSHPPPPLTPIPKTMPAAAVKTDAPTVKPSTLTDAEKTQLRQGYMRLIRLLRLDIPGQRLSERQRTETLRRLQYILLMYMAKVKQGPAGSSVFMDSFSSDDAIKKFLQFFARDPKPLSRTPSAPPPGMPYGAGPPKPSVLRPAKFATDPDAILARGPGHERPRSNAAQSHAAPYPVRRVESSGGHRHHPAYAHHAWRVGVQPTAGSQPPPPYLGQHYPADLKQQQQQYGNQRDSAFWAMQAQYQAHPPLQGALSVPSPAVSSEVGLLDESKETKALCIKIKEFDKRNGGG